MVDFSNGRKVRRRSPASPFSPASASRLLSSAALRASCRLPPLPPGRRRNPITAGTETAVFAGGCFWACRACSST